MIRIVTVLALFAACATTSPAVSPMLDAGTMSISVEGTFDPQDNGSSTFDLSASYGYFVMRGVMLKAYLDTASDPYDNMALGASAGIYYFLPTPWRTIPFAGIKGGWAHFRADEGSDSDYTYSSPRGGLAFYVADNVAVYGQFYYIWYSEHIFNNDGETYDDTDAGVSTGMMIFF